MREFDCLQLCEKNIHTAIFDTKQNNVETKGNVAFFLFGLDKTGICVKEGGGLHMALFWTPT